MKEDKRIVLTIPFSRVSGEMLIIKAYMAGYNRGAIAVSTCEEDVNTVMDDISELMQFAYDHMETYEDEKGADNE